MKLSITVDTKQVQRMLSNMQRQIPFAIAKGLTGTAQAVQRAMPAQLERDLDRPTPFTKSGFYIRPARKDRLVAEVGIKPTTYAYLRKQIEGGTFAPDKSRLKLPSEVALNQFGNIPRGLVRQLVKRAKAGRKGLTKALSVKSGLGRDASLFYGKPGARWPEGVYRRIPGGLVPVVVFPRVSARYKKRFDFEGAARRVINREAPRQIEAAIRQAIRTAR